MAGRFQNPQTRLDGKNFGLFVNESFSDYENDDDFYCSRSD